MNNGIKIKEKTISEIKEDLKKASSAIANLQAFNSNIQETNLYLSLDINENTSIIDSFKLIATETALDAQKNMLLLGSYKTKNYAVQKSLNFFENSGEQNYKEKAESIVASMLKDEIYKDALQELSTLVDMEVLKLVETTMELHMKLKYSDENKIYELFEKQYILSHPSLELVYQPHPILQELKTEDKKFIANKYNITNEEIRFIEMAAKIGVERAAELTEEFVDEKLISSDYSNEDIKKERDEVENENDKILLNIIDVTIAIYDKYNLPIEEDENGITANGIKKAAEKVTSEFIKNDTSLYYLIDKMNKKPEASGEIMEIIKSGFAYETIKEIQKENKNQAYLDIGDTEAEKTQSELKTFSL